jgi:hypothetical protein
VWPHARAASLLLSDSGSPRPGRRPWNSDCFTSPALAIPTRPRAAPCLPLPAFSANAGLDRFGARARRGPRMACELSARCGTFVVSGDILLGGRKQGSLTLAFVGVGSSSFSARFRMAALRSSSTSQTPCRRCAGSRSGCAAMRSRSGGPRRETRDPRGTYARPRLAGLRSPQLRMTSAWASRPAVVRVAP